MDKETLETTAKSYVSILEKIDYPETQKEEYEFLAIFAHDMSAALGEITQGKETPKSLSKEAMLAMAMFPLLVGYLEAKHRGVADNELAMDIAKQEIKAKLVAGIANA